MKKLKLYDFSAVQQNIASVAVHEALLRSHYLERILTLSHDPMGHGAGYFVVNGDSRVFVGDMEITIDKPRQTEPKRQLPRPRNWRQNLEKSAPPDDEFMPFSATSDADTIYFLVSKSCLGVVEGQKPDRLALYRAEDFFLRSINQQIIAAPTDKDYQIRWERGLYPYADFAAYYQ